LELEQELRKVEEIEYKNKSDPFTEYVDTFVQRLPRYAVKPIGKKTWRTKNKPLSDIPVKAHLNGQYYVGVLGKWYPNFVIFDFDDVDRNRPEEIREKLNLDPLSSMLITSESLRSYHLLFRILYNRKPPTIRLLNEILQPFTKENGIEIYPQSNKAIRLPFGYNQKPLDFEYMGYDWEHLISWFNKLDEFELKNIPFQQLQFELEEVEKLSNPKASTFKEGHFLYENGLIEPHSRHDSEWKVIYYLYMARNIPPETAINLTWHWIREKHNGYSKDIVIAPGRVKKEIERQAKYTYGKYERSYFYPNEVNDRHNGFITKADIEDIFYISKARLPKAKFLYNLVKYCYPRRYRTFIQLHSDKLLKWSMRGYRSYLEELHGQGIIKRSDSYQVDKFSKSIKINWNFRDISQAILIDERAPETFEDTVKVCYEPEEFRELLLKAGSEYKKAVVTTGRLFK